MHCPSMFNLGLSLPNVTDCHGVPSPEQPPTHTPTHLVTQGQHPGHVRLCSPLHHRDTYMDIFMYLDAYTISRVLMETGKT